MYQAAAARPTRNNRTQLVGSTLFALLLGPVLPFAIGGHVASSSKVLLTSLEPTHALVGQANSELGTSIAISGDTLAVGAPGAGRYGEVYVFSKTASGWKQEADIAGSVSSFGTTVALSGITLLVGAPAAEYNEGRAFVFVEKAGRWREQGELRAHDGKLQGSFGASLALYGTTALVGAPMITNTHGSGRAYIFSERGGMWSQIDELGPTRAGPGEWFGASVAMEGDTAVVGSPGVPDYYPYRDPSFPFADGWRPTTLIYSRVHDHWRMRAQLHAPKLFPGDQFGISVAISGSTVAVGDPGAQPDGTKGESGAIYMFASVGNVWRPLGTLTSAGGTPPLPGLGAHIALDERLLVASPDTAVVTSQLPVLAFLRTAFGWRVAAQLNDVDRTVDNAFGDSVAVDNNAIAIGDPSGAGRVYSYSPPGPA